MPENQSQVELAAELEAQRLRLGLARGEVVERSGLSYQSLQKILDGSSDFKVSNLLSIAGALGLDVALVPRGLRPALSVQSPAAPPYAAASPASAPAAGTPSRVDAALARLKPLGAAK